MADLLDKEVVMAVGATAAVMSERARRVLRRGAVYGIAAAMSAKETVASVANTVGSDDARVSSNGPHRGPTPEPPAPRRKPKASA